MGSPPGDDEFLTAIAQHIGSKVENGIVRLPPNIDTDFIQGIRINPHMQMIIRQYELKQNWVLKSLIGKREGK